MEKPEKDDEMTDQGAKESIDVLHGVHCDNSKRQYYAKEPGERDVSIMPITPFVFEYFIFNSLYQENWNATHTDNFSKLDEFGKQKEFLHFIELHAKKKPTDLYRTFEPLLHIEKTEGDWKYVKPDSRISAEDGERFFSYILQFQTLLEQCGTPSDIPTSKNTLKILRECTHFIYRVRNNIFHGSKTLGDIYDRNQKRRREVYDLFLKGLNSLFFLAVGKKTAACDFVPCPIFSSSLPVKNSGEVIDQSSILRATAKRMMKVGDSRLVARFTKLVPPPSIDLRPSEKSSLFYPSAGTDFLTPILLGLPYCTQFYFFERSHHDKRLRLFANLLADIKGVLIPRSPSSYRCHQEPIGERQCFDFEFNGVSRRLHWVHADNEKFLQEDVELIFYFHRGDSWGAGGSGQEWDSELLPKLLEMIPADTNCFYLSDGEPGGFETQYASETFELNMPFIERRRTYYCGRFSLARSQVG